MNPNIEWQILEVVSKKTLKFYACCEEGYPDITFNVTVERTSPMYKAIIVTPTFCKSSRTNKLV